MPTDDALKQRAQGLIVGGQRQVGPNLRRGVAQPHGGDVAGEDNGVGFALKGAGFYRGVERIGKAVHKQCGERGIGDTRLCFLQEALDSLRAKAARSGWRSMSAGNRRGLL